MAKKAKKTKKNSKNKSKKVKDEVVTPLDDDDVENLDLDKVIKESKEDIDEVVIGPSLGDDKEVDEFQLWFNKEGKKMIGHGHSVHSIVLRCLAASENNVGFSSAIKEITSEKFAELSRASNRNNTDPIEELCLMAWNCSPPEK